MSPNPQTVAAATAFGNSTSTAVARRKRLDMEQYSKTQTTNSSSTPKVVQDPATDPSKNSTGHVRHEGNNEGNLASYGGKENWQRAKLDFSKDMRPGASGPVTNFESTAGAHKNPKPSQARYPSAEAASSQQGSTKEPQRRAQGERVEHKGDNKGGHVAYDVESDYRDSTVTF
ncbi:hypothetical protein LTR93_008153 [Exophiala xenobiotica]|nr:hypothetical protein LTR93_008153 [Exophiala xenobiotica]KAK5404863.1 hypothetical protein LTR06_009129 [Exophiala xenobiotica]